MSLLGSLTGLWVKVSYRNMGDSKAAVSMKVPSMTDGFQDSRRLEPWSSLHSVPAAIKVGGSPVCSHPYSVHNLGGRNLENAASLKGHWRLWSCLLPDFWRPRSFLESQWAPAPSKTECFEGKEIATQQWSSWKRGSPGKGALNKQDSGWETGGLHTLGVLG